MNQHNEQIEIFQIGKNNEDIKNTILTNIVKMLTERGLLEKKNLDKNIDHIIKTKNDNNTYVIKIDFPKNNYQKSIAIKIITQYKITAVSKHPTIKEFMDKYNDMHKIIVVKDINLKAEQYITSKKESEQLTEIFREHELLINIVDFNDTPKYKLYHPNSPEYLEFFETYNIKKQQIARLPISDPLARYYNVNIGDLVKVIRKSASTGKSINYRIGMK